MSIVVTHLRHLREDEVFLDSIWARFSCQPKLCPVLSIFDKTSHRGPSAACNSANAGSSTMRPARDAIDASRGVSRRSRLGVNAWRLVRAEKISDASTATRDHQCYGAIASPGTTVAHSVSSSVTMMCWFTGTSENVCRSPFGQRTVSFSTTSSLPSPKWTDAGAWES